MDIRELSRQELAALYRDELVHTFPPAELKPLPAMERLMDRGCYRPLGMFEDGVPVSYMLLWTDQSGQYALMDYLGTTANRRGGGLGGRFLREIFAAHPEYKCVLVESEAPNSGEKDVDALRRRRLAFYERSGLRRLNYDCALFGVRYRCLVHGEVSGEEALRAHQAIYAQQFSHAHLAQYIQIPLKPGEAVHPVVDWVEEAFSAPLVTLGNRTAETAATYFERTNNRVFRRVLPQKAKTVEEAVADFHAAQRPGASSFGRTILADGRYVGDVWCYAIDPTGTPGAMVSYCVFEQMLWGQGVASKALELFLVEIEQKFDLKCVGAFTFSYNLPSIRVLEKNGFVPVEEFTEDGVSSQYFQRTL